MNLHNHQSITYKQKLNTYLQQHPDFLFYSSLGLRAVVPQVTVGHDPQLLKAQRGEWTAVTGTIVMHKGFTQVSDYDRILTLERGGCECSLDPACALVIFGRGVCWAPGKGLGWNTDLSLECERLHIPNGFEHVEGLKWLLQTAICFISFWI